MSPKKKEEGDILKDLRKKTGESQSRFAKRFGIPVATYRNWEQGRTRPSSYVIDLIISDVENRNDL